MVYTVEAFSRDVRVAIDMNANSDPLVSTGDTDTLRLDEVICAKLCDAVRMVEMEAPVALLEQGHTFGDGVEWLEGGRGRILLPDDFMRLVRFKMSDWRVAVASAIDDSDPLYLRQSSRFKGICGNPEKPVVAVVNRQEGRTLEFFSCNDGTATVEQAFYTPFPKIDADGGIDVSERLYRAAVYRAAALALASTGDQLSTTMVELSKSLMI